MLNVTVLQFIVSKLQTFIVINERFSYKVPPKSIQGCLFLEQHYYLSCIFVCDDKITIWKIIAGILAVIGALGIHKEHSTCVQLPPAQHHDIRVAHCSNLEK